MDIAKTLGLDTLLERRRQLAKKAEIAAEDQLVDSLNHAMLAYAGDPTDANKAAMERAFLPLARVVFKKVLASPKRNVKERLLEVVCEDGRKVSEVFAEVIAPIVRVAELEQDIQWSNSSIMGLEEKIVSLKEKYLSASEQELANLRKELALKQKQLADAERALAEAKKAYA